MTIFDEKNKAFHEILSDQRSFAAIDWLAKLEAWCDSKVESVSAESRNVSGSLLQPYLAAMKYGSTEAMDMIVIKGFDPTYEVLHKRQTILSEYVSTSSDLSDSVLKLHLTHVENFHAEYPDALKRRKLIDYVNQDEPFLKQDALTHLVKRSSRGAPHNFSGTERSISDCVKVLTSYGADLDRSDRNNYTALQWSIIEGNSKVAMGLIRQMDVISLCSYNSLGQTAMSLAAANGMKDVVNLLLRQRVSPSGYFERNKPEVTIPSAMRSKICSNNPLLMALQGGHSKISFDLVANGGSFSAVSNSQDMHTALIFAVKMRDVGLLDLMLKKGFSPDETNNHGFTPLLYAISNMSRDLESDHSKAIESGKMCDLLLAQGASIDTMSKNGLSSISILESMAQQGNAHAQKMLLDRNTSKLFKFILETSGVQVQKLPDLKISDEQMADMRLARVENINSVWLNKIDKSVAYKEALIKEGFSSLKKMAAFPIGASGGVYAGLQALDKFASGSAFLKGYEVVALATNHIEMLTAACVVISAGVYAYSVMKDASKKYAVGYWLKNTTTSLIDRFIEPVVKILSEVKGEKALQILNRIEAVRERFSVLSQRFSMAFKALSGDLDAPLPPESTDSVTPVDLPVNVIPMPARRAGDGPGAGLG
ncbi:ankyrin repeat domain-containing protein [Pseudomonas syringae pv. actinidiae]|nr:ankyrin repeat domain-containing protein [Pseudomonas syringae pv. actinidiae]